MAHTCGACGKTSEPYGDLTPGRGVVMKCANPECGAPVETVKPAAAPALALVATASAPRAPASPPAANGAPRALPAILAEAQARRAVVVAQLEGMKALEDELALLDRMLGATDPAPRLAN